MIELNDTNGASTFTQEIARRCLYEFTDNLIGAEFGVAYGGGIERIGKIWQGRGIIYGFDTFEGHPKEVGELCEYTKAGGGRNAFAATCMDNWYKPEHYGMDKLTLEYIESELERQGIDNVRLVKGLITEETKLPMARLHYCLLDLDFPLSMWQAYKLVCNQIVPGGYLLLHDVIPKGHILGCWEYYQKMLAEGLFQVVEEKPECLLAILKRKVL